MKHLLLFLCLVLKITANWKSGLERLCVMFFLRIVEHGMVLEATLRAL